MAVLFFVKNNIELKKDLSEKIAEKIDKERYSKNKHGYDFAKAFYVLGSVFKQFMAPALVVLIVLVLASALKNIPLNTSKPGLGSGTEEGLEEITIEGGIPSVMKKKKVRKIKLGVLIYMLPVYLRLWQNFSLFPIITVLPSWDIKISKGIPCFSLK